MPPRVDARHEILRLRSLKPKFRMEVRFCSFCRSNEKYRRTARLSMASSRQLLKVGMRQRLGDDQIERPTEGGRVALALSLPFRSVLCRGGVEGLADSKEKLKENR